MCDRIWAAVTLDKASEQWLSQNDAELSAVIISEYQIVDPWQEAIANYIAGLIVKVAQDILKF